MRVTSATVAVIFSEVLFRKLLDHSYFKVSSQQLRGTLTTAFRKTWIKIRTNSFIKTLVNITKQKPTKVPWKLSLAKKNAASHFKEHCIRIDILLVVIGFFFSQTNLIFKSNPVFVDILGSFCHSLFIFFPFDFYLYLILKFIQCLYVFFIKTSKVLMRLNVLFVRFSYSKCSYVLFSIKKSYLLTWNCC